MVFAGHGRGGSFTHVRPGNVHQVVKIRLLQPTMLSVTTELSPGHAWDTGVPTRVEVEAAKGARAAWRRGSVKCRMGACSTNKVIFDSVFGNLALSPQRHLPIHAPKDLGMGDYWRRGLGTKKACWPCLLGETPSHPEVMCTNSIAPDRGSATRNWPAWFCEVGT